MIINIDGTPYVQTDQKVSKPTESAINILLQDGPYIEHLICLVRLSTGDSYTITTPMHDDTYAAMTLSAALSAGGVQDDPDEYEADEEDSPA